MKRILTFFAAILLTVISCAQVDTVNIGTSGNSGDGESLRSAFLKVNDFMDVFNGAYMYHLTLAGDDALTLTTSGATNVTLPPSGTLATLASPAFTGTVTVATALNPDANDGATLGAAGTAWSDLFLADVGVINWNNGTITLTGNEPASALQLSGAAFDLGTGSIISNSITLSSTELIALDGVTGSLAYSTENYGATGTGDIVLSIGPTLTTVNITDVIKLTPTADPPSGATEGMIYADTDHHLYYHNGTTWVQIDN